MKRNIDVVVFNCISYTMVALLSIISILPFVMLISGSFSSESYIVNNGYPIFPKQFNTVAYQQIFSNPQKIINAYGISIFVTATGTALGLFLIAMTAYVLSRKDFIYKNHFSLFFFRFVRQN